MRGSPAADRRPLCRHLPLLKTELFLRYEEDELPERSMPCWPSCCASNWSRHATAATGSTPATRCACCCWPSIQETLQRYAIVLTRMLAQPHIEAEQLEADGLMMAERLGTLHGINAPSSSTRSCSAP